MSKHTISGFLVWEKWDFESDATISFRKYEPGPRDAHSSRDQVTIRPHSFEVEVPDGFDPTPAMIAGLEEQKRQLRLKLAAELAVIDERISKLQALTFVEPS